MSTSKANAARSYLRRILAKGVVYYATADDATDYFTPSKGNILRITNQIAIALDLPSVRVAARKPADLRRLLVEDRLADPSFVLVNVFDLPESEGFNV